MSRVTQQIFKIETPNSRQRGEVLGSARVSRGRARPRNRGLFLEFRNTERGEAGEKACFGATPQPARETRALPRTQSGRGGGVGRILGVGSDLGVSVGRGVAVGVGVEVGVGVTVGVTMAVAVAVAVGVAVAVAVGVGDGVPQGCKV